MIGIDLECFDDALVPVGDDQSIEHGLFRLEGMAAVLVAWMSLMLLAGAWRTATLDA